MPDKFDFDPHNIVLLLNSMLALDPELVLTLVSNRPDVNSDDMKTFMRMKGNKMSFLGIINQLIYDTGLMVGADCEIENGKMIYVKFFHLMEREKDVTRE